MSEHIKRAYRLRSLLSAWRSNRNPDPDDSFAALYRDGCGQRLLEAIEKDLERVLAEHEHMVTMTTVLRNQCLDTEGYWGIDRNYVASFIDTRLHTADRAAKGADDE